MPKSDPDARSNTSANSNEAATSVRLFIMRTSNYPTNSTKSFLPLPLGEGRGEGLSPSSFAPSPNPSQREGKLIQHLRSHLQTPSPQFQSRQTKQSKQNCQNQKAKDNLRLFPAHHLKVVMQGCHLEDAPAHSAGALRHLKHRYLQHHRDRLDHKYAAHHYQHEFLFGEHGNSADRAADCQAADVAHENFRRRSVKPEETQTRSGHSATKYRQLG